MYLLRHAILIPLCINVALADFGGLPTYPPPINLSSDKSLLPASWKNLTKTFDGIFNQNKSPVSSAAKQVAFSVGMFSIYDPAVTKLQYHYTSPEIANSEHGTHEIDGDSIYRIASVSKLFTVLGGLLELSEEDWHRPLTDVMPELAGLARETKEEDLVYRIEWEKITPWALAAQISGIPREGLPATNDILFTYSAVNSAGPQAEIPNPVTTYGFPPLNASELGPCWDTDIICPANEFLAAVNNQQSVFLPWTTPAYANDGFLLLGLAISNITGKSMTTVYRESIFSPLGMASSSAHPPTDEADLARSVIAGNPAANFAIDVGITIPSGGLFSTIDDLAKFGMGILNFTLLPADRTRKWMKPISHTASLSYSMGAPWEIVRYVHPSTGKVTDLYTKLGSSGFYGGEVVLIPEYGAGFSMLDASTNQTVRGEVSNLILDHVTNTVLPALEAQAAAEAAAHYVGTYVSTDPALNSSVTVSFNESTVGAASPPSLSISHWISNGTDVLASFFADVRPRLLPSIPYQPSTGTGPGARKIAFQTTVQPQTGRYTAPLATEPGVQGPFTGQFATNVDWLLADATHYGGRGVNLFVFDVDTTGHATTLTPAAMRTTLMKRNA